MALERVRISDRSGEAIPEGTGARIRVQWFDRKRVDLRCDLTDEEVMELLGFAKQVEIRPERRISDSERRMPERPA